MTPSVVFALQSPTLLNALARASTWRLSVSDMGDADDIEERCLLEAPQSNLAMPDLVVVCSPLQERIASTRFPKVPVAWMLHNGRADLLPPWPIRRGIALSERVRRLHARRRPEMRTAVVVPAYECHSDGWNWGPHVWTMLSRPHAERSEYTEALERLSRGMPIELEWYGQGRERGLLTGARRHCLETYCAAYATPLPLWAGFGLAQHECLARGVPIVGSRWGDMPDEMPDEYVGLTDDPAEQRRVLERLCDPSEGHALGRYLSELGLNFVRRWRSPERMERSVVAALGALL